MTVSTTNTAGISSVINNGIQFIGNRLIRFQFGYDRPKKAAPIPGFAFSEDNVLSVSIGMISPELLRGQKWSDYPVIRPPSFVMPQTYLGLERSRNRAGDSCELTRADLIDTLKNQAYFLYDESPHNYSMAKWRLNNRYFVARVHQDLCPDKPIYARLLGSKTYKSVTRDELLGISAGWHHFRHNYKVNFTAIGFKALDHLLKRYYPVPKILIEDTMPYAQRLKLENTKNVQLGYQERHYTFLSEPLGLQTLFALKASNDDERSLLHSFFKQPYPPQAEDGVAMTFGKHVVGGMWIGTGKYPAHLNLQEEIGWIIHDAAALGLVDMESERQVRLTPAGEAFLDIMHTDNYDPDAFMRFIDVNTLTMPVAEIERIDAWLSRFFRKMKVKVDKLRVD
jgi:hypothetical protein